MGAPASTELKQLFWLHLTEFHCWGSQRRTLKPSSVLNQEHKEQEPGLLLLSYRWFTFLSACVELQRITGMCWARGSAPTSPFQAQTSPRVLRLLCSHVNSSTLLRRVKRSSTGLKTSRRQRDLRPLNYWGLTETSTKLPVCCSAGLNL